MCNCFVETNRVVIIMLPVTYSPGHVRPTLSSTLWQSNIVIWALSLISLGSLWLAFNSQQSCQCRCFPEVVNITRECPAVPECSSAKAQTLEQLKPELITIAARAARESVETHEPRGLYLGGESASQCISTWVCPL